MGLITLSISLKYSVALKEKFFSEDDYEVIYKMMFTEESAPDLFSCCLIASEKIKSCLDDAVVS